MENKHIPQTHAIFLRNLPKEERKKLVLAGDTTAGPLAVFCYKHPVWATTIGAILVVGTLGACMTYIL